MACLSGCRFFYDYDSLFLFSCNGLCAPYEKSCIKEYTTTTTTAAAATSTTTKHYYYMYYYAAPATVTTTTVIVVSTFNSVDRSFNSVNQSCRPAKSQHFFMTASSTCWAVQEAKEINNTKPDQNIHSCWQHIHKFCEGRQNQSLGKHSHGTWLGACLKHPNACSFTVMNYNTARKEESMYVRTVLFWELSQCETLFRGLWESEANFCDAFLTCSVPSCCVQRESYAALSR